MDDDVFPEQDPRPDEDAWEAYLTFVGPLLGASDDVGLNNTELGALEEVLGEPVPFEIGLLLIMGVPDAFPWRNWKGDPAGQLAEWNRDVASTLAIDPADLDGAPQLLPIFGNVAVPIGSSVGDPASDANPLFRIEPTGVQLAGLDVADWLHKQFDMPLPWWPENQLGVFPFWSDRVS